MSRRLLCLVAFLSSLTLLLVACGGGDRGGRPLPPRDAGGSTDGSTPSDGGGGTDAGPAGCGGDIGCDDGLVCNGTETCVDDVCAPGTPVDCDDGVACTTDSCAEPSGACSSTPDDGMCAAGERCHAMNGCEPDVTCTMDADCDDGAACNGAERCDASAPGSDPTTGCVAGTPMDCDDGVACTTDTCMDPAGTCLSVGADGDRDGFVMLGCGAGTDCDDTRPDVNPRAPEICDGVDNDCNGMLDDGPGFMCVSGAPPSACTTACGSPGVQACVGCALGTCSGTEVCNGCDDDLDGTCDNGFTCCAGTTTPCMVGTCAGTRTCTTACATGTCDLGPPPANDTCAGATTTTIRSSGSFAFGTCGATNAFTASCGAGAGSADVVYRVVLSARSDVTFETTGATHDTVLHVRSACPGAELACDDDGGTGTLSRINMTLAAGTYYVVVDGFGTSNAGAGTLRATITPTGPANDECAGATPLLLGAARTTVTGSTAMATNTTGTCRTANDVWYSFTLTRRELVFINTYGSTYDTFLGMRDGSCGGANVSCTDDSCGTLRTQIVRTLGPGTYYVIVDGFGTSSGNYTLNIEHLPLGNDPIARLLPAGSSLQTGTTAGTGSQSGTCRTGTAPEDFWYWTQCPGDAGGTFDANTCHVATTYDTVLYVRSGVTGGELACNDDAACAMSPLRSRVTTAIPAGAGLFGYYVDGFSSSSGGYGTLVIRP